MKEVLLACVPKPVPNFIRPRIFYSRCSSALFYHIGNTCPIEKAIDGLVDKKVKKGTENEQGKNGKTKLRTTHKCAFIK